MSNRSFDYQWKYSRFTLFKRSINEMKKKERNNGRKLGWIYFELVVRWGKFVDERLSTEDLLLDARIELRITKDNLEWLWIASEREFRMTNSDWSVEPRDVEYPLSSIRFPFVLWSSFLVAQAEIDDYRTWTDSFPLWKKVKALESKQPYHWSRREETFVDSIRAERMVRYQNRSEVIDQIEHRSMLTSTLRSKDLVEMARSNLS